MSLTESTPSSSRQSLDSPDVEGPREVSRTWLQTVILQVVCYAVIVTSCFLAYAFVKPKWKTTGYPSYHGYGKNVEQAAVVLTLLGTTLAVIFARPLAERKGRIAVALIPWLLVVLGLIKVFYEGGWTTIRLFLVAGVVIAYFTWHGRLRDPVGASRRIDVPKWHWWALGLLTPVIAACLFLNMFRPVETLDLFHHGEIIASALDLLDGGTPYRTCFWPHGASDSGVSAALIDWTGNKGEGTFVAWQAVTLVIGFIGIFLLTMGLTLQPFSSLLIATSIASLSMWFPVHVSARSFFPILTLLLLSIRCNRTTLFAAGFLLGIGHVWRVETAVFGLATVLAFLLINRYYVRGYALDGQFRRYLFDPRIAAGAIGDGLAVLSGIAICLALSRLILGYPTMEWYRATLVDLPYYHADSTGFPIPIVWKEKPQTLPSLFLIPVFFFLMLSLYTNTLDRAVERRLDLKSFRGRFFTLLVIYLLFSLKSVMDRSNAEQFMPAICLPMILVVVNGLVILDQHLRPRYRRAPVLLIGSALGFVLLAILGQYRPDILPRFRLPGPANVATLRACLQPTTSLEELLEPTSDPVVNAIKTGVTHIKGLLDANGVKERELLIYHSGAQLYSLLDRKLPTKYYLLGWAADPAMERELIGELERNHVRAFLHVNGVGNTMREYDVPDSHRIPLVHHYIEEKEAKGRHFETELGQLTILEER
jgi:hypothetical protein